MDWLNGPANKLVDISSSPTTISPDSETPYGRRCRKNQPKAEQLPPPLFFSQAASNSWSLVEYRARSKFFMLAVAPSS